jgi:hypothetical protein
MQVAYLLGRSGQTDIETWFLHYLDDRQAQIALEVDAPPNQLTKRRGGPIRCSSLTGKREESLVKKIRSWGNTPVFLEGDQIV